MGLSWRLERQIPLSEGSEADALKDDSFAWRLTCSNTDTSAVQLRPQKWWRATALQKRRGYFFAIGLWGVAWRR
jgi:hypothetical protein